MRRVVISILLAVLVLAIAVLAFRDDSDRRCFDVRGARSVSEICLVGDDVQESPTTLLLTPTSDGSYRLRAVVVGPPNSAGKGYRALSVSN